MAASAKIDKMVATFIKIRSAKEELKRKFDEEEKALAEQMDIIKAALLDHCTETGSESVRTPHGTFFRTEKTRYWTSDWESMHHFILEHQVPQLLESRLHQGNTKKFLEDNPGLVMPGLNADTEYSITVRKNSAR